MTGAVCDRHRVTDRIERQCLRLLRSSTVSAAFTHARTAVIRFESVVPLASRSAPPAGAAQREMPARIGMISDRRWQI